jgi:hypothetical protein
MANKNNATKSESKIKLIVKKVVSALQKHEFWISVIALVLSLITLVWQIDTRRQDVVPHYEIAQRNLPITDEDTDVVFRQRISVINTDHKGLETKIEMFQKLRISFDITPAVSGISYTSDDTLRSAPIEMFISKYKQINEMAFMTADGRPVVDMAEPNEYKYGQEQIALNDLYGLIPLGYNPEINEYGFLMEYYDRALVDFFATNFLQLEFANSTGDTFRTMPYPYENSFYNDLEGTKKIANRYIFHFTIENDDGSVRYNCSMTF